MDVDIVEFIDSLKINTGLRKLYLHTSTITTKHAINFFNMLEVNNTLKVLCLKGVIIDEHCILALCRALKVNKSLKSLVLYSNHIKSYINDIVSVLRLNKDPKDLCVKEFLSALDSSNTIVYIHGNNEQNSIDLFEFLNNMILIDSIPDSLYSSRQYIHVNYFTYNSFEPSINHILLYGKYLCELLVLINLYGGKILANEIFYDLCTNICKSSAILNLRDITSNVHYMKKNDVLINI